MGTNIDVSTLPDVNVTKTLRGKKDGEIRVFRNGN